MKSLAIASVLLSTAPVLLLSAAPKNNEPVLAVFGTDRAGDELLRQSERLGLDVINYRPDIGHLIVQDRDGQSSAALYGMGARLVINADLFSACTPQSDVTTL